MRYWTKARRSILAARVTTALEQSYSPDGPSDLDALLRLAQPARVPAAPPAQPCLTDADVKAALLAYQRSGAIGLGGSALARALVPQAGSMLQPGEAAYAQIMRCLSDLANQGLGAAAAVLHTELERRLSPAAQQLQLTRSKTEYYRLRRAAIQAFVPHLTLFNNNDNI